MQLLGEPGPRQFRHGGGGSSFPALSCPVSPRLLPSPSSLWLPEAPFPGPLLEIDKFSRYHSSLHGRTVCMGLPSMRERNSGETPSQFRSMGSFSQFFRQKEGFFSCSFKCSRHVAVQGESARGTGLGKGGENEKEGEEQDFRHKLYPIVGRASFSILAPIPSLQC